MNTKTAIHFALVFGLASVASTYSHESNAECWTTAASAGAVDESSTGSLRIGRRPRPDIAIGGDPSITSSESFGFEDAIVTPNKNGTYSIRYNVTSVNLQEGNANLALLTIRYLAEDHDKSRVVVQLKKYSVKNPLEGEIAEIITVFDSNSVPASDKFQVNEIAIKDKLDFNENVYFIEAILMSKHDSGVMISPSAPLKGPALGAISICGTYDVGG